MAPVNSYNLLKTYNNEYKTWNDEKNLHALKHQEYLRRNPDAITDYDLQRAKVLLYTVGMMDKSLKENSNKIGLAYETATSLGLGYAAIGGATLGFLTTKLNFIKKAIDTIVQKQPKSKNIISMAISAIGGVTGLLLAYPAYNFLSGIESEIHRKRKFETMENELQDPRIFVVLDEEQKKEFEQNLREKNKTLIVNVQPNVSYTGNKLCVSQVVNILLDNAIKHASVNGEIIVDFHKEKGKPVLSVSNTGSNVPANQANKVFERFYRADNSRTRETGGSGLGLSIAKSVCDANNWKISAQSVIDECMTITVVFN